MRRGSITAFFDSPEFGISEFKHLYETLSPVSLRLSPVRGPPVLERSIEKFRILHFHLLLDATSEPIEVPYTGMPYPPAEVSALHISNYSTLAQLYKRVVGLLRVEYPQYVQLYWREQLLQCDETLLADVAVEAIRHAGQLMRLESTNEICVRVETELQVTAVTTPSDGLHVQTALFSSGVAACLFEWGYLSMAYLLRLERSCISALRSLQCGVDWRLLFETTFGEPPSGERLKCMVAYTAVMKLLPLPIPVPPLAALVLSNMYNARCTSQRTHWLHRTELWNNWNGLDQPTHFSFFRVSCPLPSGVDPSRPHHVALLLSMVFPQGYLGNELFSTKFEDGMQPDWWATFVKVGFGKDVVATQGKMHSWFHLRLSQLILAVVHDELNDMVEAMLPSAITEFSLPAGDHDGNDQCAWCRYLGVGPDVDTDEQFHAFVYVNRLQGQCVDFIWDHCIFMDAEYETCYAQTYQLGRNRESQSIKHEFFKELRSNRRGRESPINHTVQHAIQYGVLCESSADELEVYTFNAYEEYFSPPYHHASGHVAREDCHALHCTAQHLSNTCLTPV